MALTDSLVGYWKLDETSGNAADSVGGFTLTNNNTVAYNAGIINNGADGGSANTNKSLSTTNNLGISSNTAATSFSAWINVTTAPALNTAFTFLSHVTADPGYGRQIIYQDSGGTKQLVFSMYGNPQVIISVNTTLTTGTWYHIVVVDDGVNGTLYKNGAVVAGPTTRAGLTSSGWGALFNLLSRSGPDQFSSGKIDEVGAWSRALSAAEVTQLYNGGIGLQYPFGSIALDATAVSTDQTTSPITWNHTVTGANPLLVVGVVLTATTSAPTATGVTYNGVAMTLARADTHNTASSIIESSVWLLGNPPTGTNQVSVSFSNGTLPHGAGVSASYTGAQSSSVADAVGGANGTVSGDQTFTVTTIADLCWVFAVGINAATTSPTLVADQTSRGTVNLAATISAILRGADTNTAKTPAGIQTMGFTVGGTGLADWAFTGASFAQFTSIPSFTFTNTKLKALQQLGVGT